jgi:small neutral amino acid transporter SnatA (MarC family)
VSDILSLLSVQYTALFSIINPLGSAFVFFTITRALPLADGKRLAAQVGLYAWVTLIVAEVSVSPFIPVSAGQCSAWLPGMLFPASRHPA